MVSFGTAVDYRCEILHKVSMKSGENPRAKVNYMSKFVLKHHYMMLIVERLPQHLETSCKKEIAAEMSPNHLKVMIFA